MQNFPVDGDYKMREEPFVTVVVPTYNRKEMLKECLNSLFSQTYPKDRYEIVVVNDGSTDGTEKVLEEYAGKAPCKLKRFNQKNQGVSSAMNTGIKNSEGKIIYFTGDDCIADKNWIKNLADSFSDERVGGVGGKVIAYKLEKLVEKYSEKTGLLNQKKFKSMNTIITGNAAYRKAILQELGGFDSNLKACEDVDTSIMVQLKGYKIRYVPQAIVKHRHVDNLRSLFRQQYRNGIANARLNKKYTLDFKPSYNLVLITLKIFHRVITYPLRILKAPFVKDKRYHLAEPLLDISVFSAHFLGILNETLFGKPYIGRKYNKKLEFIGEQSINKLLRMV